MQQVKVLKILQVCQKWPVAIKTITYWLVILLGSCLQDVMNC